jgi:hypothetical protein
MKLLTHPGRGLLSAAAIGAVLAFATGTVAQVVNCPGEPGAVTNCGGGAAAGMEAAGMDTAYVPVKVNFPAIVTAELLYHCPDLYSTTVAEVTVSANIETVSQKNL